MKLKQWQTGALVGKIGGVFFSSATQHGGQETCALTFLSHFAHHGILYAPIGCPPMVNEMEEIIGGSPWGSGTLTKGDGSRLPSVKELELAVFQGRQFAGYVTKLSA